MTGGGPTPASGRQSCSQASLVARLKSAAAQTTDVLTQSSLHFKDHKGLCHKVIHTGIHASLLVGSHRRGRQCNDVDVLIVLVHVSIFVMRGVDQLLQLWFVKSIGQRLGACLFILDRQEFRVTSKCGRHEHSTRSPINDSAGRIDTIHHRHGNIHLQQVKQ